MTCAGAAIILLAMFVPDIAWTKCDDDSRMRSAIAQAIRSDGYEGSVTIQRNDLRPFPLVLPKSKTLTYYEVYGGGLERNADGTTTLAVLSHPRTWRVFVDAAQMKVFRLSGFKTASEYGDAVRHMGGSLTPERAKLIAEGYGEYVYSWQTNVIGSLLETFAMIDSELGLFVTDHNYVCYEEWRRHSAPAFASRIRPTQVVKGGKDFVVHFAIGKVQDAGTEDLRIELRLLSLRIGDDLTIQIVEDELLAVVTLATLDCASGHEGQ